MWMKDIYSGDTGEAGISTWGVREGRLDNLNVFLRRTEYKEILKINGQDRIMRY